MATRYVLDFGAANTGTSPTFDVFKEIDTLITLTLPALTEYSDGVFYFDQDWTGTTSPGIAYKASVNGIELSDLIVSDVVSFPTGFTTALLDFGSANAGTSPAFDLFANADTGAAVTPPSLTEVGSGLFKLVFDWDTTAATSIAYKVSVNGVEQAGVITEATSGTGTTAATWFYTAKDIINQVATEVGLAEVVDPYASVDANFIQLRGLLKTAGQELIKARNWKHLIKEGTITGDGTSTQFDVPVDFLRMADQSAWNRSTSLPLGNPLSSQGWQYLKAEGVVSTIQVLYRLVRNQFEFFEAPVVSNSIKYDYISRYWVQQSGASAGNKYAPTVSTDVVLFDPLLVIRLLKLKFLQAKGLDSTAAAIEYQIAFDGTASDEPGSILSLSGHSRDARLIDASNVPDTGYGT